STNFYFYYAFLFKPIIAARISYNCFYKRQIKSNKQ
ncbi:MAG: hypothetical protein ACI976_002856, partial [Aureispira sp.]